MNICPLIFEPIFKPKIWGGRRLEEVAAKTLDTDQPIGESWEVADLEDDQSVVRGGPAKGAKLGQLVKDWGVDLIGRAPLFEGRFPLLIKFLDAQDHLSVQVHPDAKMAKRLGGNVRVKNEAWYVLHAEPDGAIYRGLADGVTRKSFIESIASGKVSETLKRIPVKPGHCYYLPSGTIHALGAGVVVAEVQTPSDITYRVYDWDRVDEATGVGRTLHIEEALECINFGADVGSMQKQSHVGSVLTSVTRLVTCESFIIERVNMVDGVDQEIPTGEMMVWMILQGHGEIAYAQPEQTLKFTKGDTILVPAGLGTARIRTHDDCKWIEATIPLPSDLADYPRPAREGMGASAASRYVQLNVPKPGTEES